MSSVERVPTDPRISRRRQAIARTKKRRLLLRTSVVATAAVVVWGVFFSPLLRVERVQIVDARHTTSEEIASVAGLDSEDNLLLLSTDGVARAAQTLPWVKKAEVERRLPGTVRVRVVERRPKMVLAVGAARWTVDARGHVLASGQARKGLPSLAGMEVTDVSVGAKLRSPEVRAALRAYRSLPRGVKRTLAAVVAPTAERISFSMEGGTVIRYGAAEKMKAKNAVLKSLLARLRAESKTVAYIDVRVPTSPALSPASAGAAELSVDGATAPRN